MNKKKTPVIFPAGVLGLGLAQEAHDNEVIVDRVFSNRHPVAQSIVWGHLPHKPNPEGPGGPLRTPWSTPASTTSATAASVVLSTAFGRFRST